MAALGFETSGSGQPGGGMPEGGVAKPSTENRQN
jgi:hypothetical protein